MSDSFDPFAKKTPKPDPLGRQLRDFLQPALDDPRKNSLQLDKLNIIFGIVVDKLPEMLERDCKKFFNDAAQVEKRSPDKKIPFIIDSLMVGGKEGPLFSPVRKIPLQLSTQFTDFNMRDILALPNYIKLHEMARDMDFALKLLGATPDEPGIGGMPVLIVDLSKSYDDGAAEPDAGYPDLPPIENKEETPHPREQQKISNGDFCL